jgi:hypothetical protein
MLILKREVLIFTPPCFKNLMGEGISNAKWVG